MHMDLMGDLYPPMNYLQRYELYWMFNEQK